MTLRVDVAFVLETLVVGSSLRHSLIKIKHVKFPPFITHLGLTLRHVELKSTQ